MDEIEKEMNPCSYCGMEAYAWLNDNTICKSCAAELTRIIENWPVHIRFSTDAANNVLKEKKKNMNLMDKLAEQAKDRLSKSLYYVDYTGGDTIKIMLEGVQMILIKHHPEQSRVQFVKDDRTQSCETYGMAMEMLNDWIRKMRIPLRQEADENEDKDMIIKRAVDRYKANQNDYNDLYVLAKAYVEALDVNHVPTLTMIYKLANNCHMTLDTFPTNPMAISIAARALITGISNLKFQMDALGIGVSKHKASQYQRLMAATNEMQEVMNELFEQRG